MQPESLEVESFSPVCHLCTGPDVGPACEGATRSSAREIRWHLADQVPRPTEIPLTRNDLPKRIREQSRLTADLSRIKMRRGRQESQLHGVLRIPTLSGRSCPPYGMQTRRLWTVSMAAAILKALSIGEEVDWEFKSARGGLPGSL